MGWDINLESNNKKLNLNRKLIFYLAIVMIGIIVIMAMSINLSVEKKVIYYYVNSAE